MEQVTNNTVLTGTIVKCAEQEKGLTKDGKSWTKQDYMLEYMVDPNGRFPSKMMAFSIMGDKKIADYDLHEGDVVTVYFDIEAREYNGKFYTQIKPWKIDKLQSAVPEATTPQTAAPAPKPQAAPAQAAPKQSATNPTPSAPFEEEEQTLPF